MTYQNAAAIVADPATAVVERAPLTRAFEIVTAAVDKRVTWPILDNARLKGDGSALFVTATNLAGWRGDHLARQWQGRSCDLHRLA